MVSSLPFLAPVFLRKAKEYKDYRSNKLNGSSNQRSGYAKGSQHFRLRSLSQGNQVSAARSDDNTSQEDMLVDIEKPDTAIMKSVSYSVRDEEQMRSGRYHGYAV
jgi:hypothetical protein